MEMYPCVLDILRPCTSSLRTKTKPALRDQTVVLRALRYGGKGPRKISDARFRNTIFRFFRERALWAGWHRQRRAWSF